MLRVKICGITNLEDALMAVELGADALGFIFADSPRRIDREKARKIISKLPPFITAVGVFVNERRELVEEIANECGLDALQFHGEETPDYCSQFRKKVIKAFKIRTKDDLERLRYYDVSAYLLDSSVRGTSFNWDLLIGFRSEKPIILAGGLNPDNISSALSKFLPYGIDVSSGVEEYPGKKDREKLKKFMEVIKKWR
ncbi:phosphoribosylanthranilate isomerase [bacterium]|nr:phosphoribosylanthranilate isomerase [bacterium]